MKTPYLRRQEEVKTAHGYTWSDYYSWIHQTNCLEILQDKSKLNPEVRKYLEEENAYTEKNMSDTKDLQKKLFKEIEGRIKLEDESLKYIPEVRHNSYSQNLENEVNNNDGNDDLLQIPAFLRRQAN